MRLEHGMRVELACMPVEQRAADAAVSLAQHRGERARLGRRQPFDARLPFAVIGFQPVERRFLSFKRDEQRGMRRCPGFGQQRHARRGQCAHQPGVHVEMREGGAAARGMHTGRGFGLDHLRGPVPCQPRSGGQPRDPGAHHEEIDLFHSDSVARCGHSA